MFLQCKLTENYLCIVQLNWLLYLDDLFSKTTTVWFKRDGNIFLVLQALAIDDGILGQYTAIMGQFYSHTAVIKTAEAKIFGWPYPSCKIQGVCLKTMKFRFEIYIVRWWIISPCFASKIFVLMITIVHKRPRAAAPSLSIQTASC